MPRLNDGLNQHTLPTGTYGYSAVGIEDLGATEYTLVVLAQDESSSVAAFVNEMETCLQEVVKSCKYSPRSDNLMIRLIGFGSTIHERHGFKLLSDCNPDDYKKLLSPNGMTALYDGAVNAIDSAADYGKQLVANDFSVNAIVIIITDGCNNSSAATTASVKKALQNAMKTECLESIVTILVGVGIGSYPEVEVELKKFNTEAGLTQFVAVDKADAKTLAKLANFVSKSISSQSQSLGTGSASKPQSGPFLNF